MYECALMGALEELPLVKRALSQYLYYASQSRL